MRSAASSWRRAGARPFGLVGESGCGKTTLGRLGVALDGVREIISEPLDIARRGSPRERLQTVQRLLDEVGLAHDAMTAIRTSSQAGSGSVWDWPGRWR
jgi:ABC-type glutathione transport system ATPase component